MECKITEFELSQYHDNAFKKDKQQSIELHINKCAKCKIKLENFKKIDNGIKKSVLKGKPDINKLLTNIENINKQKTFNKSFGIKLLKFAACISFLINILFVFYYINVKKVNKTENYTVNINNVKLFNEMLKNTNLQSMVFSNNSPKMFVDYYDNKHDYKYYYFKQIIQNENDKTINTTDFIIKENKETVIKTKFEINNKMYQAVNRYILQKNGNNPKMDIVLSVNSQLKNEFFLKTSINTDNNTKKITIFVNGKKYYLKTILIKKINNFKRSDLI